MSNEEIKLPPLPTPAHKGWIYTADQMEEYALEHASELREAVGELRTQLGMARLRITELSAARPVADAGEAVAWCDESESKLYWAKGHPIRSKVGKVTLTYADRAAHSARTLSAAEVHTLRRLIECAEELDKRPRPMCRDCADEDGICPSSDLDCDMRKLFADAKALHNKLAQPLLASAAPAEAPSVRVVQYRQKDEQGNYSEWFEWTPQDTAHFNKRGWTIDDVAGPGVAREWRVLQVTGEYGPDVLRALQGKPEAAKGGS